MYVPILDSLIKGGRERGGREEGGIEGGREGERREEGGIEGGREEGGEGRERDKISTHWVTGTRDRRTQWLGAPLNIHSNDKCVGTSHGRNLRKTSTT